MVGIVVSDDSLRQIRSHNCYNNHGSWAERYCLRWRLTLCEQIVNWFGPVA